MRRKRFLAKTMMGVAALLAGSKLMDNGCMSVLASITPCGTVLTFCTPLDQYMLIFGLGEPDYDYDPSCTLPGRCGGAVDPPFGPPGQAGGGGAGIGGGGGLGGGGGGI